MKKNKQKLLKKTSSILTISALTFAMFMPLNEELKVYASGQKWDYGYTGNVQIFTAPYTGKYQLETWGAQGGSYSSAVGGKGGYSKGEINLIAGENLYIYVGKAGLGGFNSQTYGFNGGAKAYDTQSSSGGGATDIRLKTGAWNDITSLNTRLIVAGGGGGASYYEGASNGGSGGGLSGGQFTGSAYSSYQQSGMGGTQTGVGTAYTGWIGVDAGFGYGGYGGSGDTAGSGGGGGWFGGSHGVVQGGGGGSGYVVSSDSYKPSGYNVSSTYYMKNTQLISGYLSLPSPTVGTEVGHAGDGYARIIALNAPPIANISSPIQNGTFDNEDSISLKGTFYDPDSKGGTMKLQYAIDSESRQNVISLPSTTTGQNFNIDIPLSNLSTGNHTLKVYAVDNEGVEQSYSIPFKIRDKIAPTINVTGNPTSYVEGNATLTVTASDNSGSTRIKLPDGNWVNGSTATFVVSKNGSYTFIAEDSDGNQTTKTIFVDKIRRIYNPINFGYTGGYQAWIAPQTGIYKLETWGAQGGRGGTVNNYNPYDNGGKGGYSYGEVSLTAGETLYIYVGGKGQDGGNHDSVYHNIVGGWNGGGAGGQHHATGGAGGGATDVRLGGTSLQERIIVAGAGGGGGSSRYNTYSTNAGGFGGGLTGGNAGGNRGGQGAGQSSGNALGIGGDGFAGSSGGTFSGAGGGGGWYGGFGGGYNAEDNGGGGGGSSYIGGVQNGQTIGGNQSFPSPTNANELGHTGNGYAKITPLNSSPQVTVSNPINNTQFEAGSSIDLQGTIKDEDSSGTMTVKYAIDGQPEVNVKTMTNLDTPQDFGTTISLPNDMSVGNHTLYVWGEDSDTLQSKIIEVPFSIRDNINPSLSVTGNATSWTNKDVPLTVKGTDGESGVEKVKLPDGTWVNGDSAVYNATQNGSYTFVVEDRAGNQSSQTVEVEKIDKDIPNQPTVDVTEIWSQETVTASMSANGDIGGSNVSKVEYMLSGATSKAWTTYTSPIEISNEGITTVTSRVVDNAGNISEVVTKTIRIDNGKPVINESVSPNTWTNKNVTIRINGSDSLSGIQSIELPNGNKIKGNIATYVVDKNGDYTFKTTDNAGNMTTKVVSISNIDKQSPTATHKIEHVDGDTYKVTLTAEDDASGIKSIKLPNGDFSYANQATFNVTKGQTYNVEIEDNAGNTLPYEIKADVPELNVYQKDNHVKAEWAVNMLDQDVMYQTGFETSDELPNLVYSNGRTGGQSFETNESFSGSRSLKVTDTIDGNGNYYNGKDLFGNDLGYSDYSLATFTERKYVPNGTDLSLSFMAKTTGKGSIMATAQGGSADFGKPTAYKFAEDVKVGDKTIKVDNPQFFKNYVDRGQRFYIALKKGAYTYGYPISVNMQDSTITLNTGFREEFKAGESILQHQYINPATFSTRSMSGETGWTLYNMNVKIANNEYYNTALRGFALWLRTTANEDVYIDDVKMGFATKAQLFRGNTKIYEGLLSDYEDKDATDKAKPNKVENIQVSVKQGNLFMDIEKPEDNGTEYDYTVKAVSNKGDTVSSEKKNVTVTTGIDGYSYVIDKNATTVPDNTIDTKNQEVQIPFVDNGQYYIHIKSIDKAGNVSEVNHISFRDGIAPTMEITQNPTSWTKSEVQINVKATDEGLGVKRIQQPNGSWINGDSVTYTVSQNGTYSFVAEDFAGNKTTKSITISNIDKTAPSLPSINNNQEWTKDTTVSVSITAGTDSQSGVDRVEYKLDGATSKGWTTYTGTFTISNEGQTKITARTVDNLGNLSVEDVSYVRIDKSAPHNSGITIKLKP